MTHVVLLGDSVFDNGVYVAPGPDVIRQLRSRIGANGTASLLAVDGHVTRDVLARQLSRVPDDATHLVLSVGGNDALQESSVLGESARSVADAVERLAAARDRFKSACEQLLDALAARGLPTAVCTIYDTDYPEPQRRLVVAALTLFNDVIARAAFQRGLSLLDLRLTCAERDSYANPIEPSVRGGERITAVIAAFVQGEQPRSGVWT